jgi:hypothetical protein
MGDRVERKGENRKKGILSPKPAKRGRAMWSLLRIRIPNSWLGM